MDDESAFDPLDQPGAAHPRVDMRDSMFLQASMQVSADRPSVPLRVRNLSAGGLMADCSATVAQGQAVEVALRNIGAVPGRIAWVRGSRIGIAFLRRIDPRLARKPIGNPAADERLVRRSGQPDRRPGLKIQ